MTTTQLVVTLAGGATAGALLTGLVTLITSVLTRRHEHRRWLLDKRLETYVAFNDSLLECMKLEGEPIDRQLEGLRQLQGRLSELALLAPMETANMATDAFGAATAVARCNQRGDESAEAFRSLAALQVELMMRQRADMQISRKDRRSILRDLAEDPPQPSATGG